MKAQSNTKHLDLRDWYMEHINLAWGSIYEKIYESMVLKYLLAFL